jgi:hypothetical protein
MCMHVLHRFVILGILKLSIYLTIRFCMVHGQMLAVAIIMLLWLSLLDLNKVSYCGSYICSELGHQRVEFECDDALRIVQALQNEDTNSNTYCSELGQF